LSVGFVLSVMAHSPQKEAAYLFAQWLSSPEVSLERVMLPYALRDPYRRSHIASPAYRALWPSATEYLTTLETAAARAYLDLGITGAADYEASFYVALFDIRQGSEVATAMRRLADAWDAITRRHGRHRQRESYAEWLEHAAPGGM
jgi:multiple sugar transport system substrate-binding protein